MAVGTYALTTLTNLKAYLGVGDTDDDTLLENLIDRATAFVESYCDRKIMERDFYEWHDGPGGRILQITNWPINRVYVVASGVANAFRIEATVSTDLFNTVSNINDEFMLYRMDSSGTVTSNTTWDLTNTEYNTTTKLIAGIDAQTGWDATQTTNISSRWLHQVAGIDVSGTSFSFTYPSNTEQVFRVDRDSGCVYLRRDPSWPEDHYDGPNLPSTRSSVLVHYQGGFTTVPADVEQACIEVAAQFYERREHDSNLQSESLGDYSYSLRGPEEGLESIQRLLQPYKNLR